MDSIKVHNSLKPGPPVPFKPIHPGKVSWYACGPTVYDQSHLGHARNYVSTDIIRRILKDYFGFDVKFVMNITDVDDKIIIKARRQRLLDLEKKKPYTEAETLELGKTAFKAYAQSNLPKLIDPETWKDQELDVKNYIERRTVAYGNVLAGGTITGEGKPGDAEAKLKMHISNMTQAVIALSKNTIFGMADEILLPYLDSLYKETIDTSDQTIFTDLTQYMENEFTDDMDALNVLRPDVVTKVTDYVPQIAKFVERLVDRGFAYEADGSVYFDIAAFEKAGNTYARLKPESRNDKDLQEEGEGSLSKSLGAKKSPSDFALWKKSKAGEPYWPSKWGNGRPGWHIECSVMASHVLGQRMDIHSGGIDLAFPHHDNELAQSEAYYCQGGHEHTWVNYFLHMGHLSISGSKMSKSLKNFQTIKDALASNYTSRSMRIVFLLGRWNDGVEISPDMRTQADNWESTVNNYFVNTKSLLAEASGTPEVIQGDVKNLSISHKPADGLLADLEQAKKDLEAAFTNSFDTPQVMQVILGMIRKANIHINEHPTDLDLLAVEAIARWVTKIVGILGLDSNAKPPYDGLGWVSAAAAANLEPAISVQPYKDVHAAVAKDAKSLDSGVFSDTLAQLLTQSPDPEFDALAASGIRDPEQLGLPYLRAVSRIRDELRRIAPTTPTDIKKQILALSDRIRDSDLTNIGVYLDDRTDLPSLIKFIPTAELIAARREKEAKEAERARAKEEAKLAREQAEAEKWEKARVKPEDIFKADARYGEWDVEGMPTKLRDGSEVPKSQLKKLRKDWDKQKKVHEEWVAKFGGGTA
ncbi:tRNA synthetases class I (C) catalytic domain-containing protein [Pseudomassariella vexata]|uniref:cysteine--tRNA ligase n=1 Tax=Pseudomassariella vexata TaxID=1141098 RepID=A0A1Y2EHS1_9PEZI|nr:tRNA synthetases class I (C) catalytic domain-containing protein [Pseudomassariella vexata]ORY71119.1 tRNA synthetases class I (C) catalytic domain-domain-containing protein [Pseudomassariella vexata]